MDLVKPIDNLHLSSPSRAAAGDIVAPLDSSADSATYKKFHDLLCAKLLEMKNKRK